MMDGVRRALVVAAHPDDEILGCGATMARLAAGGAEVRILILATGALSRRGAAPAAVSRLKRQGRAAAKIVGAARIDFAGFPDNAMDGVPLLRVVRTVEAAVAAGKPQLVLTHHAGDLNVDHRVAHEAVMTACRPLPGAPASVVLAFEVPSATEWQSAARPAFAPQAFVDVAGHLDTKLAALASYADELRE